MYLLKYTYRNERLAQRLDNGHRVRIEGVLDKEKKEIKDISNIWAKIV